ncbi:MAG: dynamin family protein [Paludibacteraceae bacterium]|nr:dynamin family protein [Paludibacteraceae bacterium]
MEILSLLNQLYEVINSSLLKNDVKQEMLYELEKIVQRKNDLNLYIGIIGEFSSGKSTLINALIGEDYFSTSSLQGTTTVITKLMYGKDIDLQLNFKDKRILKYSRNKRKLLKEYLFEEYAKLSILNKITIWLSDLFQLNTDDEFFLRLFDKVTTSDELSALLTEVVLFYPSSILESGIVIVDTPGTDSLIPEHQKIAQYAIKEICDLTMVVVPAITPMSKTLVEFLIENVDKDIENCIFLITKIELVRKACERDINGFNLLIKHYLEIKKPNSILAPTLLSLEQRNIIEPTGLLEHLSVGERAILFSNFTNDIKHLFAHINEIKENKLKKRVNELICKLQNNLNDNIERERNFCKKELNLLYSTEFKPLQLFMNEYFASHSVPTLNELNLLLEQNLNKIKDEFKYYVCNSISLCSTKDDVQCTMDTKAVIDFGGKCYAECYRIFRKRMYAIQNSYSVNYKEFVSCFNETYLKDIDYFDFKIKINSSWKRAYKIYYPKYGLTRSPILRFFKSLESIKEQMKEVVCNKIDERFDKMTRYYIKCMGKVYYDLNKQKVFIDKKMLHDYNYIVEEMIIDKKSKEYKLEKKLMSLYKTLESVNALLQETINR